MSVDMSASGITGRLREMDDLWLLSVKLMNAGKALPKAGSPIARRALEVYDSIRQVLLKDWDPIGIGMDGAPSEYDAYIAPVYRILVGTRSESDLIDCLRRIERNEIGVEPADSDRLLPVTQKLLALSVNLEADPKIERPNNATEAT
jgi:hypothetical protein